MNIDVQAPPDDFGSSEGLCGNWNGDSSDDFIGGDNIQYQSSSVANFSKSWMFVCFFLCCFSVEIKRELYLHVDLPLFPISCYNLLAQNQIRKQAWNIEKPWTHVNIMLMFFFSIFTLVCNIYRLPANTSMFHQVPKYEQHLAPKFEYCSCKQGRVDCTKIGKGAINPSKVS